MPSVYTMDLLLNQHATAEFCCEFCNHKFTIDGKLILQQKQERRINNFSGKEQLEFMVLAQSKFKIAQESIAKQIEIGNFPRTWSDKDIRLRFKKWKKCPECGYYQRIAEKEKKPWTTKMIFSLILLLAMPVAIYAVVLYALFSSYVDNNSPLTVLYAILVLSIIPIMYFVIQRALNPNRSFIKKHNMDKSSLPAPRKPVITYGAIERGY